MSVIIKGMDMPRDCSECQFLESIRWYNNSKISHCCTVGNTTYYNDSGCPLVPVPPHGRLIDADELRLLYDFNGYEPTGDMTEEEFDRLMCRLPVIRQNIDDMPTIIEADDSGKHGKWMPYKTRRTHKNWWQCSLCGFVSEHKVNHNYCPYCGAKMKDIENAPTIIEAEEGE